MRPTLTFHKHHYHHHLLFPPSSSPFFLLLSPIPLHHHHHPRLFFTPTTTAPSPALIKTHNIPAPHTGHIRVLSLNNPRTRNAISRQLLSELAAEIEAVKREDGEGAWKRERGGGGGEMKVGHGQGTRVLILASEVDDCFCAGADLKERVGMSRQETHTFLTTLRATFTALFALPIPSISAISSLALGGGLELALSTTFRLIASTAQIGLPETRLAIIPGAGGTYRLRELIGERRAMEMVLTGRRVGGVEAGRMGVCERVVDVDVVGDRIGYGEEGWTGGKEWKRGVREKVFESAVGMAREICEGGPGAVGAAMRAVRGGNVESEEREYEAVLDMSDRDEALRAFGEKRKAVFRGR